MAYQQSDLDNLDNALKTGVQTVTYAGRTVTFRSVEEMLRVRAEIVRSLSPGAPRWSDTIYTR
jgi:hypothetical protein